MDIFKEYEYRQRYHQYYDEALQLFQCPYEEQYIETSYGTSYVLRFDKQHKSSESLESSNRLPLVLLHGMTMSSVMWYPNVKKWVQHFTVYAIDIAGDIGKSVPNEAIMLQEEAVQWLAETVNALGLTSFILAGHSIGGYIALRFTLAHQERVAKLALFAPAAAFHRLQWKFFYYAFPGLLFQTEKWIDRAFRSLSTEGLPFAPAYHELILYGYRYAFPLLRLYPLKIDEAELGKLHLPILLMIGEQEVIYPAQQALEYAQAAIPHIQTLLVNKANHTLTLEYADLVNDYALAFFTHPNG